MRAPTTHCQICARAIKTVRGWRSGELDDLISHHGYRRPHQQGWQTASCFGARYRPYEVACDALPEAIKSCEAYLARREEWLRDWLANPPETILWERRDMRSIVTASKTLVRPEGFKPQDRDHTFRPHNTYEGQYTRRRMEATHDIASTKESLAELQKRLAEWQPPAAAEGAA
jgi:hypothetical protein